MKHLLIECDYQLLSMNFAALEALKTAIGMTIGEGRKAKVSQSSASGIIKIRSTGPCLKINAANQNITIMTEDVPILLELFNNLAVWTNRVLSRTTAKGGYLSVMSIDLTPEQLESLPQ